MTVFDKIPYKDTKKLTLINCLDVKIRSSFFEQVLLICLILIVLLSINLHIG